MRGRRAGSDRAPAVDRSSELRRAVESESHSARGARAATRLGRGSAGARAKPGPRLWSARSRRRPAAGTLKARRSRDDGARRRRLGSTARGATRAPRVARRRRATEAATELRAPSRVRRARHRGPVRATIRVRAGSGARVAATAKPKPAAGGLVPAPSRAAGAPHASQRPFETRLHERARTWTRRDVVLRSKESSRRRRRPGAPDRDSTCVRPGFSVTVCAYRCVFFIGARVNDASLLENENSSARRGVAAGQLRARGPRTDTTASLRSSTECSRRGSVRSSAVTAPGGTGGVVATATRRERARRAGRRPRAETGAEASVRRGEVGAAAAPTGRDHKTGAGEAGRPPPRGGGAVERRASPPDPTREGVFFPADLAGDAKAPCAVAQRKARGVRETSRFLQADAFSSLCPLRGVSFADSRSRVFQYARDTDPAHSTARSAPRTVGPPPSRRPSPCWRSAGVVAQAPLDGGGAE